MQALKFLLKYLVIRIYGKHLVREDYSRVVCGLYLYCNDIVLPHFVAVTAHKDQWYYMNI
jgi:hypothetical protein